MGWSSGGLAVACLAVGLLHLLRLAMLLLALRRRGVAAELSYAAMGLGMAAMFSPLGDPVSRPVWTVVFAVCATWFGAAVLRSGSLAGEGPHHVVGSAAMLFMLAAGHAMPTTGILASVVAIGLAAYFLWHALRCADRCRRPESLGASGAPAGSGAVSGDRAVAMRAPFRSLDARLAAGAHLVMAVAMAVMLLGML